MSVHVAGLDLGQLQDYTGLIIMEVHGTKVPIQYEGVHELLGLPTTERETVEIPPVTSLDIRHIERFPLNTKYLDIAKEMGIRLCGMPRPYQFAIDQTGVGVGVAEMMRALSPVGITITGSEEASMVGADQFRVPKRDLVNILQVHNQNHTLRIAKGLPHAAILMSEMQHFRYKISVSGHDSYEAWRERDHDDLVLAAGIAAWVGKTFFEVRLLQIREFLIRRQMPGSDGYRISPI